MANYDQSGDMIYNNKVAIEAQFSQQSLVLNPICDKMCTIANSILCSIMYTNIYFYSITDVMVNGRQKFEF